MVGEGGMGVIVFSWDLTKGHQSCVACAGVIAHITRPADGAADRGDWKNRAFFAHRWPVVEVSDAGSFFPTRLRMGV